MTARFIMVSRRLIRGGRRLVRRLVGRPEPARPPYAHLEALDTPRLVRIPLLRPVAVVAGARGRPRLTVLLPALQLARLTGGPNTAINLAVRLLGAGIRVRLVSAIERADADLTPLRAHVAALVGRAAAGDDVELLDATGPAGLDIEPDEVVMATWWPTAHVARAALEHTRATEFLYLIQDYEPAFYPWSTNFALAEATYGFPHRPIFNEELLREFFRRRTALAALPVTDPAAGAAVVRATDPRPGVVFEPAVDRTRFHPPAPGERPTGHRLLFYARPQQDRNAFELGLGALRLAAANGAFRSGRWTASSIGSPLADLALGDGLTLTNVPWLGLDAYAALLRGSDVLLALMISPHTSYPPLEMAACGGLVVTNTFDVKTAAALAGISPRIRGVAADLGLLAVAIAARVHEVEARDAEAAAVADRAPALRLPGTWDAAFEPVMPWLVTAVRELSGRA